MAVWCELGSNFPRPELFDLIYGHYRVVERDLVRSRLASDLPHRPRRVDYNDIEWPDAGEYSLRGQHLIRARGDWMWFGFGYHWSEVLVPSGSATTVRRG